MALQRGTPIDRVALPAWARPYLSERQQDLPNRALQWVLMFDHATYLESSTRDLARRLHIATLGRDEKSAWASQAKLAAWTGWSEETVRTGLTRLAKDGWVVAEKAKGRRSTGYRLAWPDIDPISRIHDEPERCLAPLKKGEGVCMRRAGWGTTTPGKGPCKLHGGDPRNPTEDDASGLEDPQPLGDTEVPDGPVTPQPLGGKPVDNTEESSLTGNVDPQPLGIRPPTIGGVTPQPLGSNPPTIGGKYVRSARGEYVESADRGSGGHGAELEDATDAPRDEPATLALAAFPMGGNAFRAAARVRLGPDAGSSAVDALALDLARPESPAPETLPEDLVTNQTYDAASR